VKATLLQRVSVLIVTWKGDDLLRDCLVSLASVYGASFEIVVVDNAEMDSTRQLVAGYPNAKYVSSGDNLGFAGGNNLGWPLVTNEYVVLLNNDTRLTGDSISPLVDYLDAHPTCAAAQGTVVFEAQPDKTDGTGLWWSPLGILAPEGFLKPLAEAPSAPREVFAVGGAFFIARRSAVEKAGGLFYDHFRSYYEEINLCHRLWLVGYDCAYVPTVPVLHRHSATTDRLGWDNVLGQYYRNIWFSTLTCFGFPGLIRFVPSIFILCLGQSLAALCRGNAKPLKAHVSNFFRILREWPLIASTRRSVRSAAVLSDRELLRHALRRQEGAYYWRLFKRG